MLLLDCCSLVFAREFIIIRLGSHDPVNELRTILLHTRQSEVILEFPRRKSSSTVLLKTVDLCLEMSSDFKNKFCFVVEQIFELRNTAKSRCLGVRVEAHANLSGKSLGSIRGRQTTVDALIGN